uniref:Putative secreted protein n=1 Tax=Anopheles darlingi TaxID=43151 RepID=A0A2M4D6M4_ANODA
MGGRGGFSRFTGPLSSSALSSGLTSAAASLSRCAIMRKALSLRRCRCCFNLGQGSSIVAPYSREVANCCIVLLRSSGDAAVADNYNTASFAPAPVAAATAAAVSTVAFAAAAADSAATWGIGTHTLRHTRTHCFNV